MRPHRSPSGRPYKIYRPDGPTVRLPRAARKALTRLIVPAFLALPVGVVLVVLDILVNRKVRHLPWLHLMALPFEAVAIAAILVAVATLWIRLLVGGARVVLEALLIVVRGRSVPGTSSSTCARSTPQMRTAPWCTSTGRSNSTTGAGSRG